MKFHCITPHNIYQRANKTALSLAVVHQQKLTLIQNIRPLHMTANNVLNLRVTALRVIQGYVKD